MKEREYTGAVPIQEGGQVFREFFLALLKLCELRIKSRSIEPTAFNVAALCINTLASTSLDSDVDQRQIMYDGIVSIMVENGYDMQDIVNTVVRSVVDNAESERNSNAS